MPFCEECVPAPVKAFSLPAPKRIRSEFLDHRLKPLLQSPTQIFPDQADKKGESLWQSGYLGEVGKTLEQGHEGRIVAALELFDPGWKIFELEALEGGLESGQAIRRIVQHESQQVKRLDEQSRQLSRQPPRQNPLQKPQKLLTRHPPQPHKHSKTQLMQIDQFLSRLAINLQKDELMHCGFDLLV
jgi:hypothetical protein